MCPDVVCSNSSPIGSTDALKGMSSPGLWQVSQTLPVRPINETDVGKVELNSQVLVAVDPPAKSLTFGGVCGKPLDFHQKVKV